MAREREKWEVLFNGYTVSVFQNEKVVEICSTIM